MSSGPYFGVAALQAFKDEHRLNDYDVPWWAIPLVQCDDRADRVRKIFMGSQRKPGHLGLWKAWLEIVTRAREKVMARTMNEWIGLCQPIENGEVNEITQKIRDAALSSPRAFVQWIGLTDDDGHVIVLKDFHVATINAIRQQSISLSLLPYEHGKSMLGNIPVPLMDWAEWRDCTECRVYLSPTNAQEWVPRLKQQVEFNWRLHRLFPWVRRPSRESKDASQTWNLYSFSIGGRTIGNPSFVAYTAKAGKMGHRAHRTVCDDWVTSTECNSFPKQDKYFEYFEAGPMTFRAKTTHTSKFGTAWSTVAVTGTLFAPYDFNSRLADKFKDLGYPVQIFDIYPSGPSHADTVLWPEHKSPSKVRQMLEELGKRVFDMRCRNKLELEGTHPFPEATVKLAEMDGTDGKPSYVFGVVPTNTRLMIGLDPASGRLNKGNANPALFLYGQRDLADVTPLGPFADSDRILAAQANVMHHLIKWQRLSGYPFTRQCDTAIVWARQYGCPIGVEDNQTQAGYADYISKVAPDVQVVCHTTGDNKRDPHDGVEQFVPLFENKRVVIHATSAPLDELNGLRREFSTWPKGRYSDLVMALWIARFQLHLRIGSGQPASVRTYTPPYARNLGTGGRRFIRIGR